MYTIVAYLFYLFLSVFTVVGVGRSLHRQGKIYLFGECPDDKLSTSTNNFLYIGYCLLNTGFALFFLGTGKPLASLTESIEFVAASQGIIFLTLGLLHFLNILLAPKIVRALLEKKLLTNKTRKS